MVPLMFAGHALHPLPEGALWWPSRRALLVADLHLEKASSYARGGQMLPPYDSLETLTRLSTLAEAYACAEIWCLGDSYHEPAGIARLCAQSRVILARLVERCALTWIVGNHDPAIVGVGGRVIAGARVDGIALRHEACPDDRAPEISGHFHPKLRVSGRGRSVARRCFVCGPGKLVLPAFGALAGGLDVDHPAIRAAVGRPAAALVPAAGRLLRFELA